ncbi:YggS family pyridoxal phosphate-dependent enzyme [Dysgonomonas macrotermitis]|uniref:Pyridoxal phosphate homeostasis protein n=1 Tax=Dysgonomonas macrotermitis TaxID=1346286 RepID=A0A1M4WVZ2_9BACT|nr:YggS family pyridoxal phosphate-dependent enzyme [Dysgonomonas macrotermitis]SHE85380.1 hypothetical protein SAMN05444362_102332 [Dysgonomonas macrotermitis]
MSIASNLDTIKSQLPERVKLVAISKFHPKEALMQAYNAGQRVFGESRVQELDEKAKELPSDIEWHLIGHLQTNKVKFIVPYIHTIQSVDSWKILTEINKHAQAVNRTIRCLLEIKIAQEDTKYGFSYDECREMLDNQNWSALQYIQIAGVMGMATLTDDEIQIRNEFKTLNSFYEELKDSYFSECSQFCEISMGMSHDYKIAIEEGATIVRVGTSIFGEREY